MNDVVGLENVTKIKIEHINGKLFWLYNYKVDVIDYQLIINGQGYQSYQYPSTVPLNETYARPTGYVNLVPGTSNWFQINMDRVTKNNTRIFKEID